jgi:dUTPase
VTEVLIARLPHADGLPLPSLGTPGAAGYDIASADEALPGTEGGAGGFGSTGR